MFKPGKMGKKSKGPRRRGKANEKNIKSQSRELGTSPLLEDPSFSYYFEGSWESIDLGTSSQTDWTSFPNYNKNYVEGISVDRSLSQTSSTPALEVESFIDRINVAKLSEAAPKVDGVEALIDNIDGELDRPTTSGSNFLKKGNSDAHQNVKRSKSREKRQYLEERSMKQASGSIVYSTRDVSRKAKPPRHPRHTDRVYCGVGGVGAAVPVGYSDRALILSLIRAEQEGDQATITKLRRIKKFIGYEDNEEEVKKDEDEDSVGSEDYGAFLKLDKDNGQAGDSNEESGSSILNGNQQRKLQELPMPKCASQSFLNEDGTKIMILSTVPCNEELSEAPQTDLYATGKSNTTTKTRTTLADALQMYSDYHLQIDDRFMYASELDAWRLLEKERERKEFEEWLNLPEIIPELDTTPKHILRLELRVAFSVPTCWINVDSSFAERDDVPYVPLSPVAPPVSWPKEMFQWWTSNVSSAVQARSRFLEIEMEFASQNQKVRVGACYADLELPDLEDKMSTNKERRMVWRDFRSWYYGEGGRQVREQLLLDESARLQKAWTSDWGVWKRYKETPEYKQYVADLRLSNPDIREPEGGESKTGLPMRWALAQAFTAENKHILNEYKFEEEWGPSVTWRMLEKKEQVLEVTIAMCDPVVRAMAESAGLVPPLNDEDATDDDYGTTSNDTRFVCDDERTLEILLLWFPGHSEIREAYLNREMSCAASDFVEQRKLFVDSVEKVTNETGDKQLPENEARIRKTLSVAVRRRSVSLIEQYRKTEKRDLEGIVPNNKQSVSIIGDDDTDSVVLDDPINEQQEAEDQKQREMVRTLVTTVKVQPSSQVCAKSRQNEAEVAFDMLESARNLYRQIVYDSKRDTEIAVEGAARDFEEESRFIRGKFKDALENVRKMPGKGNRLKRLHELEAETAEQMDMARLRQQSAEMSAQKLNNLLVHGARAQLEVIEISSRLANRKVIEVFKDSIKQEKRENGELTAEEEESERLRLVLSNGRSFKVKVTSNWDAEEIRNARAESRNAALQELKEIAVRAKPRENPDDLFSDDGQSMSELSEDQESFSSLSDTESEDGEYTAPDHRETLAPMQAFLLQKRQSTAQLFTTRQRTAKILGENTKNLLVNAGLVVERDNRRRRHVPSFLPDRSDDQTSQGAGSPGSASSPGGTASSEEEDSDRDSEEPLDEIQGTAPIALDPLLQSKQIRYNTQSIDTKAAEFTDFKKWYGENRHVRTVYLQNRISKYQNFCEQMTKRGQESFLAGAGVFDAEETMEIPPVSPEIKRHMKLVEIRGWYKKKDLYEDDERMCEAELCGREQLKHELIRMQEEEFERMRQKLKADLEEEQDNGFSNVTEKPVVLEVLERFRFSGLVDKDSISEIETSKYQNGTGLENDDETYFATLAERAAEQAEKIAEEERRIEEMRLMYKEEQDLKRFYVLERRSKLSNESEKELNDIVLKAREEERQKRENVSGMSDRAMQQKEWDLMAKEDEDSKSRWAIIDIFEAKQREAMEQREKAERLAMHEEDVNQKAFVEAVNHLRKRERVLVHSEIKLMRAEDAISADMNPIWENDRIKTAALGWMETLAYRSFKPFCNNPPDRVVIGTIDNKLEKSEGQSVLFPKALVLPQVENKITFKTTLSNKFQQVLGIPSNCRTGRNNMRVMEKKYQLGDVRKISLARKKAAKRVAKRLVESRKIPEKYNSIEHDLAILRKNRNNILGIAGNQLSVESSLFQECSNLEESTVTQTCLLEEPSTGSRLVANKWIKRANAIKNKDVREENSIDAKGFSPKIFPGPELGVRQDPLDRTRNSTSGVTLPVVNKGPKNRFCSPKVPAFNESFGEGSLGFSRQGSVSTTLPTPWGWT